MRDYTVSILSAIYFLPCRSSKHSRQLGVTMSKGYSYPIGLQLYSFTALRATALQLARVRACLCLPD